MQHFSEKILGNSDDSFAGGPISEVRLHGVGHIAERRILFKMYWETIIGCCPLIFGPNCKLTIVDDKLCFGLQIDYLPELYISGMMTSDLVHLLFDF